MSLVNRANDIVDKWVEDQVPADIRRLVSMARFDLYYGPLEVGFRDEGDPNEPYPGFSEACDRISRCLEDIIEDVWVDMDCEDVSTSEPEGFYDGDEWIEPFLENVYHFDRGDVKRAYLGELASYL